MARTLTQLRQLTAQQTALRFISGTADSGGSTTTLVDSILQVYNNDKLIGLHLLLTAGADDGTETIITDSVQSTGTVTLRTTLSEAPDTDTYEILPFAATEFTRAIQDASLELYDTGHLVRPAFYYFVSGSPVYNADWAYWTSTTAVDGWTVSSSTLARERGSGNTYNTPTSVKLTSTAGTLTLDAVWRRFLLDLRGETVTLYCPVKSDTASSARINLNNGSNNYSSYHGGGDDWEVLSVEVDLGETDSDVYVELVHDDSGATDYFGMPWIETGSWLDLPFPLALLPDGPTTLEGMRRDVLEDEVASGRGVSDVFLPRHRAVSFDVQRHHDENATFNYGLLRADIGPGFLLKAVGEGPVTITSTNTDNIEVSHSESMLIAVKAAILLLERALPQAGVMARTEFERQIVRLQGRLNDLLSAAGQATDHATLPLRW